MKILTSFTVVLSALCDNRFWSAIRRDVPLVPVLLGVVVGQAIGDVLSGGEVLVVWREALICAGLLAFRLTPFTVAAAVGLLPFLLTTRPPQVGAAIETTVLAQVVDEPNYRIPGGMSVTIQVDGADGGGVPVGSRLYCRSPHLPWRNFAHARQGSVFLTKVEVRPFKPSLNPFSFDSVMRRRGVSGQCKIRWSTREISRVTSRWAEWRAGIEDVFYSVTGRSEESGLLLSMMLGFEDTISTDTERAFKSTGLSHLLVLSGYQVAIVYGVLMRLVGFLGSVVVPNAVFGGLVVGARLCAIGTSAILVLIAGFQYSGARALLALVLLAYGAWIERGGGVWNRLCGSLLALLVLWPGCLFEPGVQLTFAALVGLALGATLHSAHPLWCYLVACCTASLLTSAVSLAWFGTFSPIGFVVNVIFAPVVSLLSCKGGLLSFGAYYIGIDGGGVLLSGVIGLLALFRDWVVWLAILPGSSFTLQGWRCALLSLAFLCIAGLLAASRLREWLSRNNLVGRARGARNRQHHI